MKTLEDPERTEAILCKLTNLVLEGQGGVVYMERVGKEGFDQGEREF